MKYSCSLLIDKTDTQGVKELLTAVDKAIAKGKATKWSGKLPKFKYEPLRDGDEELASGEKTGSEYKGRYFINCSSKTPVGVVDPYAKPLMDQDAIFAGCVVRADLNPFPYATSGNKGIGWGLNNVMLVREGPRLDGRQRATDAFAGFAADTSVEDTGDTDMV